MIRLRVVCRAAEVEVALARLRQSFATVTASTPLPLACCTEHVRLQVRATF